METVLVDSCIFIDIFRGNNQLLKELKQYKVVLNAVVYMELIQGARDKLELQRIDKFLKGFDIEQINERISEKSMELVKALSLSNGLLAPDALIAAHAVIKGYTLWTFNKKHFKFIENLTLH